jgi:hypothetical protein
MADFHPKAPAESAISNPAVRPRLGAKRSLSRDDRQLQGVPAAFIVVIDRF